MLIITVMNFKGGSSKSTTTGLLAHAFEQLGKHTVAVVDADPQGSMLHWADTGGWDLPVVGLPSKDLRAKIRTALGSQFDIIIVDTPGYIDQAGIVYSSIRAADFVLIPMGATTMEVASIHEPLDAVREISELQGRVIPHRMLLTRTMHNATSTKLVRKALEDMDVEVFGSEIKRIEAVANVMGTKPTGNLHGHVSVAMEILEAVDRG